MFDATTNHRDRSETALRLFVAGAGDRSQKMITRVRRICDRHLPGRYRLEVVDALQQPERAREAEVVVLPTLVRERPGPPRRFVGLLEPATLRAALGVVDIGQV